MKRRDVDWQASPIAVRQLQTGRLCPRSGWWSPDGQNALPVLVLEGKSMPTIEGKVVAWRPFAEPLPVFFDSDPDFR